LALKPPRKEDQYYDLIVETRNLGYTPTLIMVEMGSIGFPNMLGFQRLSIYVLNNSDPQSVTLRITDGLLGSYNIWCSRNDTFT